MTMRFFIQIEHNFLPQRSTHICKYTRHGFSDSYDLSILSYKICFNQRTQLFFCQTICSCLFKQCILILGLSYDKLTFLTFDETKQVVNTFVSLFHTNILVGSTIYAERYLLMDLVCKPPRWQMFAKTCFYWSNPALSYSTLFCKFSKPSAGVNYGSNSSSASNCPMAFISKKNVLSDIFPVAPFSNLWMVVMVMPDCSETSFCVMLLRRR